MIVGTYGEVTNSGTIMNGGVGLAISKASGSLNIQNADTGVISTQGDNAVRAEQLTLRNDGFIRGSVISFGQYTYIDNRRGTIDGDVVMGNGENFFIGRVTAAGVVETGVTGSILGGWNKDSFGIVAAQSATLSGTLLPAGFERLSLIAEEGATLTIGAGAVAPGRVTISGNGTIVNATTISGSDTVVQSDFGGNTSFRNDGSILSLWGTDASSYAVYTWGGRLFINTGEVVSAQGGVSGSDAIENYGLITAAGTAVRSPALFTNFGTIESTAGTAVMLTGYYENSVNHGVILGKIGVQQYGNLENDGSISGTATGVLLTSGGRFTNDAQGIVTSGGNAIESLNGTIINRGRILGNVLLVGGYGYPYNRYETQDGGTLVGDLYIGPDSMFVTDFIGSGNGKFAGVEGTVTADMGRLRYRVSGVVTGVAEAIAGFAEIGFLLEDGSALTLGKAQQSPRQLVFAGDGTVDVDADIDAALDFDPAIRIDTMPDSYAASELDIISRGVIKLAQQQQNGYAYAVQLNLISTFENAGTLTVSSVGGEFAQAFAIVSGSRVVNSGTIDLDRATGVLNTSEFVNEGSVWLRDSTFAKQVHTLINHGTITQNGGDNGSIAAVGLSQLVNSGTIDVGGMAVSNTQTIENSGLIRSTGDLAISAYASGVNLVNAAGGVIDGEGFGTAIRLQAARIENAGVIRGDVDLAYMPWGWSSGSRYVSNGGILYGNLTFGSQDDVFLQTTDVDGVTGAIDGGDGFDIFGHLFSQSGDVTLGKHRGINFESEGIYAENEDTVVRILAGDIVTSDLALGGLGQIENNAHITGKISAYWFNGVPNLRSFVNNGEVNGVSGNIQDFTNNGVIHPGIHGAAVSLQWENGIVGFQNNGMIDGDGRALGVSLWSMHNTDVSFSNTGLIEDGSFVYIVPHGEGTIVNVVNSGTLRQAAENGSALNVVQSYDWWSGGYGGSSLNLENSGLIEANGARGEAIRSENEGWPATVSIVNSGTIRANGGGELMTGFWWGEVYKETDLAAAISVSFSSFNPVDFFYPVDIRNLSGGVIEATGEKSAAIFLAQGSLALDNAGVIRGGEGTYLDADDGLARMIGSEYVGGAIHAFYGDDVVHNSGTIIGSVDLGEGNDSIANYGVIIGDVFLRGGDDSFTQWAGATLTGIVDGGDGIDSLIIDATGGGAINGDQFIHFERFSQIGEGEVTYSGNFTFDSIHLDGGTIIVASGENLSSDSDVTIAGGDANETVLNHGTIWGTIDLAGGNDKVVNGGVIGGDVLLGDGDDQFTDEAGSQVAGVIDGGAGSDLYRFLLAGDRSATWEAIGFERLEVAGSGTLDLTLTQGFERIDLAGANLLLADDGFVVGRIVGSDADERLTIDSDIARVELGGGNDALTIGAQVAAGRYDGGAGVDELYLAGDTLSGVAVGFERVGLLNSWGDLTVRGQLGSSGGALAFTGNVHSIEILSGGRLLGNVDLGGGDSHLDLADGSIFDGVLSGGAGTDSIRFGQTGAILLDGARILGFEQVSADQAASVALRNSFNLSSMEIAGDLSIQQGARLATTELILGGALDIQGGFAGSIRGNGANAILLAAGDAANPVNFADVSQVGQLRMASGYAQISGKAGFTSIEMQGGRIVGLAGSEVDAGTILVGKGATFGSAGLVKGNLTVAGTLSPGAPTGTMTVNGNVTLGAGSTSIFEITPTASDKLLVSGSLSIASGASLVLDATQAIRPGTSLDLIVASGGISGSFTSIVKPGNLFGFIVQQQDRLRLLGQFLNDSGFTPQVQRSIAYTNALIEKQQANGALLEALPQLLSANGQSNPDAFARLTPEPYASIVQFGVENGLMLADATRDGGYHIEGETKRGFAVAQVLGGWRRLSGNTAEGVSEARSNSYGVLGGLGFGSESWSVAAFGGYLNGDQKLQGLDARTDADGYIVGVQARYATGPLRLGAMLAYSGLDAHTVRAVPGAQQAQGTFRLKSWIADASLAYEAPLGGDWAVQPRVGLSFVSTSRQGLTEFGGSPWNLTVAEGSHDALFADGAVRLTRAWDSPETFRPFLHLGLRYQLSGKDTSALAGFGGGSLDLLAIGLSRASLVGAVAGGADVKLTEALSLFGALSFELGNDDRRTSGNIGMRLAF